MTRPPTPSLVGEGLGDVRLGVTHQALELLTRRVDVGPVDRVRLPAPAVAVLLAHVSPLGWEHINLTGEYRWPSADRRAPRNA